MALFPDINREDVTLYPAYQLPDLVAGGLDILAITHPQASLVALCDLPLHEFVALVAKKERADLKVLFAPIDIRQRYGKVYLTGAGAGDRDCLTIRADALLRHAGVIFYDDLIDTSLLEAYTAEKIYVGKRKGHHHADQEEINRQLFLAATKKQVVVRLKGGDPFIFGRGGEEMSYLLERHIDVEVVPGVSAMQCAAASARIPLTRRGVIGGVTILSAHNALAVAGERTLVYYMCASRLTALRQTLLDSGLDLLTSVALIYKAGFADEAVTMTTVDAMDSYTQASPLLALVGRTVSHYRERPKILYTGDEPCRCLIPGKIVPLHALKSVQNLSLFSAIACTHAQHVDNLLDACGAFPQSLVLYAYGSIVADKLRQCGYAATVIEVDSISS